MAPVSTDSTGAGFTVGRVASASERSKSPTLQARVAFSTDMGDEKLTIGASGHFGLEEVGTVMIDPMTMMEVPTGNTETASSYAAVLDLTVPIAGLFTLQGEAFYGQNLDGLFSRADVNRFDGEAIAAWGGWAQLLLNLDPLTFGVAAGIERFVEDPEARNLALYLAAIYTVAPGFKVGLQLDHIRTNAGMGDDLVGNQINASAHFGF
jgi:hypothetical protein